MALVLLLVVVAIVGYILYSKFAPKTPLPVVVDPVKGEPGGGNSNIHES